jgi:hypothetical protein
MPTLLVALVLALTLALPLATPAGADDPMRYVVPKPASAGGWMVWASWEALGACAAAVLAASRRMQRPVGMDCNALVGRTVAVGDVQPGTFVERLDSPACRDNVQVRVLAGPFEGAVGCITGRALIGVKPA